MVNDDHSEDRLRALLRDDRWSLPPWPDLESRVHRTARRQRLKVAGVTAGTGGVIIAAAAVPLVLLTGSRTAPVIGPQPPSSSSASPSPTRPAKNPHPGHTLPAVGAPGFPASIYPPPLSHKEVNLVGLCPNPAGLQPPAPGIRATALKVVEGTGRSFRSDLHITDRVYWPQVLASWRHSAGDLRGKGHNAVLYSGPLESYHQAFGAPDMIHLIVTGCGRRVARDTWMIVEGQVNEPALQGEYLLLTRRGHVLLWNSQ